MNQGRAESGVASKLGNLHLAFKENKPNVQGDGDFRIESGPFPAHIAWRNFDNKQSEAGKFEFQTTGKYLSWSSSRLASVQTERSDLRQYESRLAYLRKEAAYEDRVINTISEKDFRHFVESQPHLLKGDLVLVDNGNLRAIWENNQGAQIGLQFLGGSSVQFVVFVHRSTGQQITRVTGRDTLIGLLQIIRALDVESLLFK